MKKARKLSADDVIMFAKSVKREDIPAEANRLRFTKILEKVKGGSQTPTTQTGIGACRATDLWRTAMSNIGTPAYCCDKTGIMRPLGAPLAQKLACRCVQLTGWME